MAQDDLEARVSALETHVGKLTEQAQASKQDAAAARILAGAADRDVADFGDELRNFGGELRNFGGELRDFRQAATSSFNALREDLTDLRGYVDNRFDRVDGRLTVAAAGQQRIVELLEQVIADQG